SLLADAQAGVNFSRLLARGKAALMLKQFDVAVTAFTEAVTVMPADKEAQALLKGSAALQNSKWDDAITAFTTALTLVPNDPEATKGLQAANEGKMKDDAKDSPKGEPKKDDKKIPPKEEPKADDPDERRAKLRLDLAMKNLEEAAVERGRGN